MLKNVTCHVLSIDTSVVESDHTPAGSLNAIGNVTVCDLSSQSTAWDAPGDAVP